MKIVPYDKYKCETDKLYLKDYYLSQANICKANNMMNAYKHFKEAAEKIIL